MSVIATHDKKVRERIISISQKREGKGDGGRVRGRKGGKLKPIWTVANDFAHRRAEVRNQDTQFSALPVRLKSPSLLMLLH